MNSSWTKVTPIEAAAHPLYGVKNWLAVFAFGVLFGLIGELGEVNAEAHRVGLSMSALLSLDYPVVAFLRIALLVDIVVVGAIYWLLLTKHRKFRQMSSVLLIASWPIVATIGALIPSSEASRGLALSLIPWALYCGVWVTYLNRSKRVRVTFEHAVSSEEHRVSHESRIAPTPDESPPMATARSPIVERSEDHSTAMQPKVIVNEEELWATALSEFEGDHRRKGLWAKCFSVANGNESQAKATYLRERTNELLSDLRSKQQPTLVELSAPPSMGSIDIEFAVNDVQALKMGSPEECTRKLIAHGCRVRTPTKGVWEILNPSGVTAYARSPEALQAVTYRHVAQVQGSA